MSLQSLSDSNSDCSYAYYSDSDDCEELDPIMIAKGYVDNIHSPRYSLSIKKEQVQPQDLPTIDSPDFLVSVYDKLQELNRENANLKETLQAIQESIPKQFDKLKKKLYQAKQHNQSVSKKIQRQEKIISKANDKITKLKSTIIDIDAASTEMSKKFIGADIARDIAESNLIEANFELHNITRERDIIIEQKKITCSICYQLRSDFSIVDGCNHAYCSSCLYEVSMYSNRCPGCRNYLNIKPLFL